jgi:hypothetical protein
MNVRFAFLAALAAAVLFAAASARGVEPAAAPALRFKLELTRPMLADGKVRLEPGVYDVAFEPSPAGPPRFTAVFFRGGVRIATAPGQLKGAPAGVKTSDIKAGASTWGAHGAHVRRDGAIVPFNFDVHVKSERAFFESLLTEVGMPALDASSKAPATITITSPKATPAKR